MPSPWLFARKSGLYCRVFVPTDLRPTVGQRFLVRALEARDRDQARLIAAHYAAALGDLFRQLRRELSMAEPKVEDVVRSILSGGTREAITITTVSASGAPVSVKMDSAKDLKNFKKEYPGAILAPGAGSGFIPAMPSSGYGLNPEQAVVLSERIQKFVEQQREDSRTQKYIDECVKASEILIDFCGDLPPNDYTPTEVSHFKSRVKWLPRNPEKGEANIRRWGNRTHTQRSAANELTPNAVVIQQGTINKHINRLSAIFEYCKGMRYLTQPNPFFQRTSKRSKTKGGAVNAKTERKPYDMAELEQIFDPARYKTRKLPHSFWPPLIALMTGARVNEIAQLYLADVVDDDPQNPGRWRFMILAKEKDQRVKNVSSLRSIPMHPKLIEMGFLTYLEDVRSLGYKRVFPTLRYTEASGFGDSVSEFYMTYLREQVKITDPLKVFHSFRYYFCHWLFNKSQNQRMHIVGMTGHVRDGVFERTYAGELNYADKLEILMTLALPEIKIEPYKPGGFIKYFKKYEANEAARLRRIKEQEAFDAKLKEMLDAAIASGEDPKIAEAAIRTKLTPEEGFSIKAKRERKPKLAAKKVRTAK